MSPHDGMECPMCGGVGRIFNITKAITAAVDAGAVAVQPLGGPASAEDVERLPTGLLRVEVRLVKDYRDVWLPGTVVDFTDPMKVRIPTGQVNRHRDQDGWGGFYNEVEESGMPVQAVVAMADGRFVAVGLKDIRRAAS